MNESAELIGLRLLKAIREGDLARCRSLILTGADLAATDVAGRTPLHVAVDHKEERPEIVRLLIESGAPVGVGYGEGQITALHLAAHRGHAATVKALLEAGADVNARDSYGSTPLHIAALWNRVGETIGTLITHGADATARDNDGHTAVEVASNNGHSGVEVQIMALEAGVKSGWVEPNSKGGDDG